MKQWLQQIFPENNRKPAILNGAYLIFVVSLLYQLIAQLFTVYDNKSWQITEFLINYQGGFVRRGLTGELLFFLVGNFNVDIECTIKIVCLVCFLIVCIFFVRMFTRKGYSLYILPLCFFLGGIILSDNWIRKDFMFFCFLIPILWIYGKSNLAQLIKILIINILSIFIILSHEVFAFFALPVLLLLFFDCYKSKGVIRSLFLSSLCLLPGFLAFLLCLYHKGNVEISQVIWDSWMPFFTQKTTDIGHAVDSLGWSGSRIMKAHFKINFFMENQGIFSSIAWIVTFPVIYYITTNALLVFRKDEMVFTNRHKIVLSSILIFQLFCLTPVFTLLSCDYIRVIFYWIASSFAIFIVVPIDKTEKLFPDVFVNFVVYINKKLTNVLFPTKTVLVFLMMFVGISPFYFVIEWTYKTTMLYNILFMLSKPFILLKSILLNLIQ